MARPLPDSSDLPLLEQAALWFDRVSGGDPSADTLAEFERWRGASPAHQLAFGEIEAAYAEAKAAADSSQILALRHEALSRIVMPRARRAPRLVVGGAIAASLFAIAGTWSLTEFSTSNAHHQQVAAVVPSVDRPQAVRPIVYRTAIGERLTVSLPDGSSATLNTASRLRLDYSASARRLILEQGQALFRVAKGQARPFIVQALDRLVTAHGTVFDVRIKPHRIVRVALLEGSVSVARSSAPLQSATELQPKEVLVASNNVVQVSREPEIDKEVSWREGLIIFQDESLADAAAEVNRYVKTPIVLEDDRLRKIRVSGAFRTGETAAFVEALQLSFPVRIAQRGKDGIVLAYRD
jgi:transmembrane sensor